MPQEIERRFLVNQLVSAHLKRGDRIIQGYLPSPNGCTIRVRIVRGKAYLTSKGPKTGYSRTEVEREIGLEVAFRLLREQRVGDLIEKTRYEVDHNGFCWEVDVFHGVNSGLVIAELELNHVAEEFPLPGWIGDEVTDDPSYSNSALSRHPVAVWRKRA
jgi:CYTH domain-containing protein